MYLVTHVFGDAKGMRSTEVYLWTGDDVSTSHIEQGTVHARKAAKDASGTIEVFRRGKESANFFAALGGIVITRRSSSASTSSRGDGEEGKGGYVLCGRNHMGHVAFDQVPFRYSALCPGYPHIIAPPTRQTPLDPTSSSSPTERGTLYLWKGRGSSSEELGCARLISMDLSPSSHVIEIEDDGSEPQNFLELFPDSHDVATIRARNESGHWKLKPCHDNFAVRLYRVEAGESQHVKPQASPNLTEQRPSSQSGTGGRPSSASSLWGLMPTRRGSAVPDHDSSSTTSKNESLYASDDGTQRVVEVSPFSADEIKEGVCVLDAWFEIYVYVSSFPFHHFLLSLPSPRFCCFGS